MIYRIAVMAVTGFSLLFIAGLAHSENPEMLTPNVLTLLENHDRGLRDKDIDLVVGTFSSKPDTILMGTGNGEIWVGQEQIKDAYQHFFADYDHGSMETRCTWQDTGSNGQLAWLIAMCQVTDYLKNIKREYALNVSGVAENENGTWRFRNLHFSNITAPE